ncbi:PDR/VanB family oxidoreductase [Asaia astilbis]
MSEERLTLRVTALRWLSPDVLTLELRSPDGTPLPAFEAGAHIDLHLPNGITRSYSLCNDPAERSYYLLGIGKASASRGGSRYIFDDLRLGTLLPVSAPRNHFALDASQKEAVLIAGGIGATPILSMAYELARSGRPAHIYYAVRNRADLAFMDAFEKLASVTPYLSAETGTRISFPDVIAAHPDAHFYCCGPTGMLDSFEEATATCPPETVHLERFAAKAPADDAQDESFIVECVQSGLNLTVQQGESLGDCLADAGIDVALSCREGVCGSCETKVLSGEIDHRDGVLSQSEKLAGKSMMVCVSRCKGQKLVLDL